MFKPTRVDAFDHVKFRLTGPLSPKQLAELKTHCHQLTHEGVNVRYAPNWPYVLEVSQPNATFFPTLLRLISTSIGVEPAGAEVARDYTTRFHIEAKRMQQHFLQRATLRYGPWKVTKFDATIYFGGREHMRRMAIYADKPSKLSTPFKGMNCLHTEVRLKGSAALRAQGLGTLAEFVRFDFDDFWHRNLSFWDFDSRSALGRVLRGKKSITNESARARVRRMFHSKRYLAANIFVLQKAMAANPLMARALERIDAKTWEEQARGEALDKIYPGKR